ncbi:MAG: carbohydrate ABC transporter permease [Clostridia bacterium]|nr:carbohydrate ABC transporter permease [Clostridia bacterium]
MATKRKNRVKQDIGVNLVINIFLILAGVIALYPVWFVLIASISDPTYISRSEVLLIPKGISFSAYKLLKNYPEIFIGYRNSIFYMFVGSFICLSGVLPAAFALSRRNLVGRKFWNTLIVISMYFSGGMIPTYLLHRTIGWIDTVWVLIIPGFFTAYYLILARSAFQELPETLYEAARIDGSSDFRFFFQFAIPLTKAMIAVIFLFSALAWWNNYTRFLVYIDNPNLQSIQVVVKQITEKLTSSLSNAATFTEQVEAQKTKELLKYSIVVITALPFCILYPFIQKYFNTGVMIGAIKE